MGSSCSNSKTSLPGQPELNPKPFIGAINSRSRKEYEGLVIREEYHTNRDKGVGNNEMNIEFESEVVEEEPHQSEERLS